MENLHLPLTEPVLVVALAAIVFLSVPLLFERLRVPAVIGLILAGIAIGPHGLGWLARDETMVLLGTVGLLYLMFMAALEIDLHGFRRYRSHSVVLGLVTFAAPLAFGLTLGRVLGLGWPASLLLGSLLSSHTLLSYPVAVRLGIGKNIAVTSAVGGTIVTDLLALLMLAVSAAAAEGTLDAVFWLRLGLSFAVFSALVLVGLPRLAAWFFRRRVGGEAGDFLFIAAALLASAAAAELAGFEPIIGAFFAGLALNPLVPEGTPLHNRLQFFGDTLLMPFFLLSVGMLVDLRVFTAGAAAWGVMLGMLAAAVGGKWLAARITRWRFGYTADEGWTVFGLSVPQAAATLALVLVGRRLELFDQTVLNGAILLILVTCTLGPWVVERWGRRVALREELAPARGGTGPQRILVPLAGPPVEPLFDLAFLLRPPGTKEPLVPLAVIEGYGRAAPERVAAAEKLLGQAAAYAAGASVPVEAARRVAPGPVAGIIHGIAEWRASAVVLGWDGVQTRRTGVLNELLDELIARTRQLTFVARLTQPLGTTKRVLLLLPPWVHHGPGFADALHDVKLVTSRLGASLRVLSDAANAVEAEAVRRAVSAARPRVPTTFVPVPDAAAMVRAVRDEGRTDDLVVLVADRRGMVGWSREVDRLPRALASASPDGLIVIYPSPTAPSEGTEVAAAFSDALAAGRVALGLPPTSIESALAAMLRTHFRPHSPQLHAGVAALAHAARTSAVELAPGAVFLRAGLDFLPAPLVFAGLSPEGIALPKSAHPVRLVVAVAGPDDVGVGSRFLAEIAPLLANPERVERLSRCETLECVRRSLRRQDLRRAGRNRIETLVGRARGLAEVGGRLEGAIAEVVEGYARRLRAEPMVPEAAREEQVRLEDHADALVAEIARALILLDEGRGEPSLLTDGTEIQRLIADLHGAQRRRLGWTEDALRREFDLLEEEITAVLRPAGETIPPGRERALETALDVVRALIDRAEQISLAGFRAAAEEASEPEAASADSAR
jgi:Kef-type K+ transport system membrane component KefB